MQQNWRVLERLKDEFGDYGAVVRVAVAQGGWALEHASERRLSTAWKRSAFGVAKKWAGQSVLGRPWHALLHGIGIPGRGF